MKFSLKMKIALLLLLALTDFSWSLICGQKDQCICRDNVFVCRGTVPVFAISERENVQLTWDMLNENIDHKVDYDKLLHAYEDVIILNAPLEACFIDGLKQHLKCTYDEALDDKIVSTTPYDTIDSTDERNTEDNVVTLHSGKVVNVELSLTEKAIIITLAVNTAKVGIILFLTYQILVSLVYVHSRLNAVTRREEPPTCIINCMHKWMRCSYCCLRCICCCFCKRLRAPTFEGIYICFKYIY